MGNLGHVQLFIRMIVGIFLLLAFSGFVFFSDSSSSASKISTSDENLNLKNTYKYIMKSYFDKFENLDDFDYKDFIEKELPVGLCNVLPHNLNLVPRLLALERKLIGEGSHRQIASSLKISLGLESIPETSLRTCGVVVIERLPLGVFADPFELQHLRRGVISNISVFGDTNLESPSFLSNRSAVEIHLNVGPDILRQKKEVDFELKLPLHARYVPLNEMGYSQVSLDVPDLFLHCSVEEKSINKSCLYVIDSGGDELQNGEIIWKIPSGIKAQSGIVYFCTFMSASLAALFIVLTSIRTIT